MAAKRPLGAVIKVRSTYRSLLLDLISLEKLLLNFYKGEIRNITSVVLITNNTIYETLPASVVGV